RARGDGLGLVGLGFDAEAGAGQAEVVEAGDQLVGQGLGGEGGDGDPVGGRVGLGRPAEGGGGGGGGLGGRAAGGGAEADQQVGEVGAVEGGHREGGQEGAAAARRDDGLVAGGQCGGEGAVGDPDLAGAPNETSLVEVAGGLLSPVTPSVAGGHR